MCVCVCVGVWGGPILLFWCQYFKTKLWNFFWKWSLFSPGHVTLVISFFHSFIESFYKMKGNSVNTPTFLTYTTHLEKFLLSYIHRVTLNQFSPYLLKLNLVTRTPAVNLWEGRIFFVCLSFLQVSSLLPWRGLENVSL